ncbi:AAA family ATPase, partial [Leucobacter sp. M11]|uniref:AAA family ATPase n=1 Tax=Leucobacter sp. M11 TaxID=2993565 RepID=UPI002D7E9395
GAILIDGRAGSGKTTLAAALADALGADVVHLDDLYPGWQGLAAASAQVADLLREGRWQRYDWAAEALAEWHRLAPDRPIVIEGCGATTRDSAPLAALTIWVDAPEGLRRDRALRRDGELFRPHWDAWAAQEAEHLARNRPAERSDRIIRVTADRARLLSDNDSGPEEPGTLVSC